jgi:hypothetical protein
MISRRNLLTSLATLPLFKKALAKPFNVQAEYERQRNIALMQMLPLTSGGDAATWEMIDAYINKWELYT